MQRQLRSTPARTRHIQNVVNSNNQLSTKATKSAATTSPKHTTHKSPKHTTHKSPKHTTHKSPKHTTHKSPKHITHKSSKRTAKHTDPPTSTTTAKRKKHVLTATELYEKGYPRDGTPMQSWLYPVLVALHGWLQAPKLVRGIYTGSFMHITPSMLLPSMVYVDSFKGSGGLLQRFFEADNIASELLPLGARLYEEEPIIKYVCQDYTKPGVLAKEVKGDGSLFDILFSFASTPSTKCCAGLVHSGGFCLVDDEHGDASLAKSLQDTWSLEAVFAREDGNVVVHAQPEELARYFVVKKTGAPATPDELAGNAGMGFTARPVKYSAKGVAYLFRKR